MLVHYLRPSSPFYQILIRESHVLVLVNQDVDALCAARILMIKCVVLINCGANVDLIDKVTPPPNMKFLIVDSHRPIFLDNIYDEAQIFIGINPVDENELNIPQKDQIYLFESSDEEDSDEDAFLNSPNSKRRRQLEERAEKIEKRNKWKKERSESATLMFGLAHQLSRDSAELLWWAIVGFTSQLLEGKMSLHAYTSEAIGDLRKHVRKLAHQNREENGTSVDNLRIYFDKELRLSLYRHWSLIESFRHSISTMCQFQLWTQLGWKKLQAFLVELGLPLNECKQKFESMSTKIRKEVLKSIEDKQQKYKLDVVFGTFVGHISFTHKLSALDVACSLASLLEFRRERNPDENFITALDSMSIGNIPSIYEGIELYKEFLEAVVREVSAALNQHHIRPSIPFLTFTLNSGNPDLKYFQCLHGARTFGRYLLRAFITSPRGRRHEQKPLILEIPFVSSDEDWYLVLGIPPVDTENDEARPKSFLGNAFEEAAKKAKCRLIQENFDTSFVQLKAEDRIRFQDALSSFLV